MVVQLIPFCNKRQIKWFHENLINKKKLLKENTFINNALIKYYGDCGELEVAKNIWKEFLASSRSSSHSPENVKRYTPDKVTYTSIMQILTENGCDKDALEVYDEMAETIECDAVLFTVALGACANLKDLSKGKEIHEKMSKQFLENKGVDIPLWTTLLHFYGECGELKKAKEIWAEYLVKNGNIFTYTAFMKALIANNEAEEAIVIYEKLVNETQIPRNLVFFTVAINACANAKMLEKGREIHMRFEKDLKTKINLKSPDARTFMTTLLHFYGICNDLESVENLWTILEISDALNTVVFNAMMTVLGENGKNSQVLELFEKMGGKYPKDEVSYTVGLSACGKIGAHKTGVNMHNEILNNFPHLLETEDFLNGVLIDFYGKCGDVENMKKLFPRNTADYSAMIGGYAKNGYFAEALETFELMKAKGYKPNEITFISVLNACAHVGDAAKAITIYKELFEPNFHHFSIAVDCLARKGAFKIALNFIENERKRKGMKANEYIWTSLYGNALTFGDDFMIEFCKNKLDEL